VKIQLFIAGTIEHHQIKHCVAPKISKA